MSGSNESGCGLGTLGIVLVVLKLCGLLTLSWFWVLAPFWMPWAFFAVIFMIALLCNRD